MSKGLPDLLASEGSWFVKNLPFSDGPDVDRTVWTSPQWISANDNPSFFGQTAIRNQPDFGYPFGCVPVKNGHAQLVLSTWNPLGSGVSFLGSQISTIEKWGLASYDGAAFEARVRCPAGMPGGAVTSLFSYNLLSTTPFQHDEIDFEFASNFWQGANEAINTNVYFLNNTNGIDQVVSSSADFSQPIDLLIHWTAEKISWYMNGTLMRTETQVPPGDMSLTLNFWVPASSWSWAYNANLLPSGAPGTQWIYEVEYANVYYQPKQQAG
jgi:beta-glucanase (GH16 family)